MGFLSLKEKILCVIIKENLNQRSKRQKYGVKKKATDINGFAVLVANSLHRVKFETGTRIYAATLQVRLQHGHFLKTEKLRLILNQENPIRQLINAACC